MKMSSSVNSYDVYQSLQLEISLQREKPQSQQKKFIGYCGIRIHCTYLDLERCRA